ncbi:hypothetical protein N7539_005753 [Penicillium diatomitis]|uniref:Uncharacterized protein n=1 Tax=Penicillium diatomitis TaxID=2819901 RepID=A0A9W9X4T8_9EURO|nr:uncharacterized protein N7539_005753 [Penicillium diatomitis]KAJ5483957.1 hypothetical protein N7539_005753 [Penicillium diatomitis]
MDHGVMGGRRAMVTTENEGKQTRGSCERDTLNLKDRSSRACIGINQVPMSFGLQCGDVMKMTGSLLWNVLAMRCKG